jgi:Sulfotransferase family
MLISHRKKFIFTKTVKTAGTSIESYFEQYCMPDGEWQRSHVRDEYASQAGIIGCRKGDPSGSRWYNHMSAQNIRNEIGIDVWDEYFKFTAIRNPFDKLVSGYFMFHRPQEGRAEIKQFKSWIHGFAELVLTNNKLIHDVKIPHFLKPIECSLVDRDKYIIDGKECVDFFIPFENLYEGIKFVCDRLKIPFQSQNIPEFKKGIRHHNYLVSDYYDHESENIARNIYAWEIHRFGYKMPE